MAKIWMADYPPDSPSAYDDEFADSSFDTGKWTEWDVSNKLTVVEGASGLNLTMSQTAGENWSGVFQAAPSSGSSYTIWSKVSVSGYYGLGAVYAGILLGQDLTNNPSTSDVVFLAGGINQWTTGNGHHIRSSQYTAYNGTPTEYGAGLADSFMATHYYLRLRRSGTTLYFDFSTDGIGWQQLVSTAEPFTPAQIGIACCAGYGTYDCKYTVGFFRCVVGTPALADVMQGKRVM
jgi:hypothetical protein